MAKERVTRPGPIGALEDAVDAVKSYAGAGKRNISSGPEQDAIDDTEQPENTPSNAGMQAQSSDSANKYQ